MRRDIQQPVYNNTSKAQDFCPFACQIEHVSLYCTKILITNIASEAPASTCAGELLSFGGGGVVQCLWDYQNFAGLL